MAACYSIRLATLPLSAAHRSQMPQSNANVNSLAGGSALSYGPLVLNVLNIVCEGYVRAAMCAYGSAHSDLRSFRGGSARKNRAP
jgi:hypothetical protein